MALTRKLLKGMGLTDEQVDTIIEAHTESTDGLKNQLAQYKTDAEKLPGVQQELDALKAAGDGGYKEKYEAEHSAFETYKTQVETEKTNAVKTAAVSKALKDAGVQRDVFVDLLMSKIDLGKVEIEGDGVKDVAALIDPLKSSYGDCFATIITTGTPPANPPSGGNGVITRDQVKGMSRDEINANWDAVQAALRA